MGDRADREDDHDECGDEFVGYNEWASSALGVTLFTDFVYDYDGGERGVFVAEDIVPQTRVVSVPFASMLTLEWLRAQAERGHAMYSSISIFRALVETPHSRWNQEDEDDLLALALLYERFVANHESFWRPHLDLLPTRYDNLLYFTDFETQKLRGSNVFFLAQQIKRKVKQDFARLEASVIPEIISVVSSGDPQLSPQVIQQWFSMEQYQWALSTVWSRFVSLRMHTDETGFPVLKAMAPVFDMLNHDPYAEVSHRYNPESNALEVVTHQHVSAGTQLCINYGAVSNHKLLTLYGFVVPGNPFDTIDLWLPMDKDTTKEYQAKAQALLAIGIDHELTAFELSATDEVDVDPAMLLAARVMALECQDEHELDACVEKIKFGEIVTVENEIRALSMLIHTLEATLQLLKSIDSENEADEEEVVDESINHRHVEMALFVRGSDHRIMENTVDVLKKMLLKVTPDERQDE